MGISSVNMNPKVTVEDAFWSNYKQLVAEQVIPYQWKALNDQLPDTAPSHAIENFRIVAREAKGDYFGTVFQDSDVAKWLETVAYSLRSFPDSELEEAADDVISLMGRAQAEDGYLNTYYMLVEPENRWTNLRDNHELYCAGHLIEAAVAYYETTGKRAFLDIVEDYVELIRSTFGREDGKLQGYSGHPEIELALLRLFDTTGKREHLELAAYFIEQRGQEPHYFDMEKEQRQSLGAPPTWNDQNTNFGLGYAYMQAHLPVRQQQEAVGHSVRAMYLYAAMAYLARRTNDAELQAVCGALWDDVTNRKMYITGGLGSAVNGEAFTDAYDLPNDSMYCETCASVGLVFWAKQMLLLSPDRKYADVLERAIYNGTISGMDLDGKRFFYVNPLEVNTYQAGRKDQEHVKQERQKWFACACCPPNLARLIASIEDYAYTQTEDTLYTHLYIAGSVETKIKELPVKLTQSHQYPWDAGISVTVEGKGIFKLAFRIPGWCDSVTASVNGEAVAADDLVNGYLVLDRIWESGDQVELFLPLPVMRVYSNPKIGMNQGQVALQRGPIIYCLEEVDNGKSLAGLRIPRESEITAAFEKDLLNGVVILEAGGFKASESEELYQCHAPALEPVRLRAIPYYAWCNRQAGEMRIWTHEN
ncbi:glycoside hydrolase family 127 protein [Terribacillus saccharophilus]|uniref:glycoside hydrolase family 127 protein n=1 Tax=Terribacillus saccharophilus TaxID=361277 RepID=UPI00211BBCB0|nr:beta-L-arabinofuranosidase domain-containing protein [Terribacillus saccharophilus]